LGAICDARARCQPYALWFAPVVLRLEPVLDLGPVDGPPAGLDEPLEQLAADLFQLRDPVLRAEHDALNFAGLLRTNHPIAGDHVRLARRLCGPREQGAQGQRLPERVHPDLCRIDHPRALRPVDVRQGQEETPHAYAGKVGARERQPARDKHRQYAQRRRSGEPLA
jgi:hypothetical protein